MTNDKPMRADEVKVRQLSPIWIIPIVALIIGCWMVYDYFNQLGTEIQLNLRTAEGIEVGKTFLKSRNVNVGVIESIKLSDDYSSIVATARVSDDAVRMLKEDSRLWVVKPRIGMEGISGLDTLLSGAYIELEPGKSKISQYEFTVLEHPPVASVDEEGVRVTLFSQQAGKLDVGDPVLYEGFKVGRVENIGFDTNNKKAFYQLFINKPYDDLVRKNSQFWLTSGINMQLSAKGLNLQVGSLESLLTGGVSFQVPKDRLSGDKATDGQSYSLYDSFELAQQSMYDEYLEFVMLFDESIRGLHAGASVEFRGITIGEVVKAPLTLQQFDSDSSKGRFSNGIVPVLVKIELARVFENANEIGLDELKSELEREINIGLRASLKTGSLITGALFIDLDLYPDDKAHQAASFMDYPIFPTKRAGVAEIQKQVGQLINKFNHLPIESVFNELNNTLKSSSDAFSQWDKVGEQLTKILQQGEMQALPAEVQQTLKEVQNTAKGYAPGAGVYNELEANLQQLKMLMKELEPLSRQLNNKPNSLIMGGEYRADPVPARGK